MPRKADPKNAAANARQAKWRRKLKEAQRPEGSKVDVAMAAAFSAVLADLDARGAVPPELLDIVSGAIEILVRRECSRKEAARMVNRRLLYRDDLQELRGFVKAARSASTGHRNA